eukprot:10485864-Karenia_brevis.AAC.1
MPIQSAEKNTPRERWRHDWRRGSRAKLNTLVKFFMLSTRPWRTPLWHCTCCDTRPSMMGRKFEFHN